MSLVRFSELQQNWFDGNLLYGNTRFGFGEWEKANHKDKKEFV